MSKQERTTEVMALGRQESQITEAFQSNEVERVVLGIDRPTFQAQEGEMVAMGGRNDQHEGRGIYSTDEKKINPGLFPFVAIPVMIWDIVATYISVTLTPIDQLNKSTNEDLSKAVFIVGGIIGTLVGAVVGIPLAIFAPLYRLFTWGKKPFKRVREEFMFGVRYFLKYR